MPKHGKQTPSFQLVPAHVQSDGPDAVDLVSHYGFQPDKWQKTVMEGWLGTDNDLQYTASDCGLAVPRQNGKNGILEFVELYMMAICGLKVLHTAHEVKTCRKHFMRMKDYFDNARTYPELHALVKYVRSTNGQEAIVLNNGGSVEFIARSKSSGRGFTCDILVCDEAQELTDEQMEAIQPAISAAPSGNPMTIYTGTPTPPSSPGTVFARLRRRAHADNPPKRLCWYEWAADEIGDVTDQKRWYEYNPALGIRLQKHVVISESEKMTPDGFARERLGWWNDQAGALSDIEQADWQACATDHPCMAPTVSYAIKFSGDGSRVSLAACVRPTKDSDDKPHVELLASKSMRSGTRWLSEWLTAPNSADDRPRWRNAINIVVDGRVGAPTLINSLLEAGVPAKIIVSPRSHDMIDACAMFEQAVNDHALTHFNQEMLNESIAHSKHRRIGDGFGYMTSSEAIDVSPTEAVALAYWNTKTSKRHPERRQRIRRIN